MPTTLTNGIQLPDKGSVDWYSSMQSNYNLIDTHLGDTNIHVTTEDKARWDGKANASHTHTSSELTDIDDYATKQYVDTSISGLVDNAPDALNTLNELSAALNDDSNFASTVTTALAAKANSADLATVATSGSYTDLTDKPTINDSTITIQKNGSTVDTFTTNGSAKTINIPVPTKTSDLTNDSNFVDTSNPAVASGITSAKVTDYDTHIADTDKHVTTADKNRWNNNTYVLRYSSTTLVASSTNSNSLLDNTDNLKVGDKVIDSSGVIYSVTAIDTANSTFTIGTSLIDLAQDSDVVHKSGNETVGGIKSFSDDTYIKSLNFTNEVPSPSSSSSSIMPIITTITYGDSSPSVQARLNLRVMADGIKSLYPHENSAYSLGLNSRLWSDFYTYHGYFRGQQQNDEYSGNARTNLTLLANRDTLGQSGCVIDTFRENTSQGTGSHVLGFGIKENSVRYEGCRLSWFYDDDNNGYIFTLRPTTQGTNRPIKYELGNSTSKWTTVNGLEPSALGMPDLDNGIDISSYITHLDKVVNNYTPPANGYILIRVRKTTLDRVSIRVQQNYGLVNSSETAEFSVWGIYLPVIANQNVEIYIYADDLASAKFYPCQGNV